MPSIAHSAAGFTPPGLGAGSIIGESRALRDALVLVRKVAASRRTTVLIVGETGTGKELFARAIHYAGEAAAAPFVAVNCAAIPETLLESELFGHERGAFTDARAQKRGLLELAGVGTLFLDEIAHMPQSLQPKLLRALEERRVRRLGGEEEYRIDCRIIAATNVPLEEVVRRREFREDLYYRLNVFRVDLPPLRTRDDDAVILARHFLADIAREQGSAQKALRADAEEALRAHFWPGNVRELKNVIERAAILCGRGEVIRPDHLMIQERTSRSALAAGAVGEIRIPAEGKTLAEIEREAVELTMRLTHGNQSAAARILGISRPTLARILRSTLTARTSPEDG